MSTFVDNDEELMLFFPPPLVDAAFVVRAGAEEGRLSGSEAGIDVADKEEEEEDDEEEDDDVSNNFIPSTCVPRPPGSE